MQVLYDLRLRRSAATLSSSIPLITLSWQQWRTLCSHRTSPQPSPYMLTRTPCSHGGAKTVHHLDQRPSLARTNGPALDQRWTSDGTRRDYVRLGMKIPGKKLKMQDLETGLFHTAVPAVTFDGVLSMEVVGVPRTSTHWMGLNTTPTCDCWYLDQN